MRRLLPFDVAALGAVEMVWLFLAVAGLALLARPRVRWLAPLLAAVATCLLAASAGAVWWKAIGLALDFGGVVLVAGLYRPRRIGSAVLAALLALSTLGRPFGLHPLRDLAGWIFLASVGVALAAAIQVDGPLRRLLSRRVLGRVPAALPLSLLFLVFCATHRPFGVGTPTAAVLLLLAAVVHEVIAQGEAMQRYVQRRVLGAPVVLLILLTLSFFVVRLAPGGPFAKEKRLDPEIQKAVEAKYGFHKPLAEQFSMYLRDMVWEGDLGPSFKHKGRTVNEIIAGHIGPTALLGVCALALTLLIGVTAGLVSGLKQNSIFDYASMTGAMIGLALPTFVVGPMLVLLFAMHLGWFRVSGWDVFPRDLILPALTLSLPFAARVARLTRAGMLEVVNQDYIRTARAKGLSETTIVLRHALKGALLPVVAFLGPGIAVMLTGSLVVEMIFGVPGIGREFVESATNRDYSVALGLTLLFGALIIAMNLLVDIAYAFLDPRIRHG